MTDAKKQLTVAQRWKDFYEADRTALAALFTRFDMYTPPGEDLTEAQAMRFIGQRDVLLWITRQLGLRPEHFLQQAWDDAAILERLDRVGA